MPQADPNPATPAARRQIRNTRAIAWVIQRGVAYDRAMLDAKLAAAGVTP